MSVGAQCHYCVRCTSRVTCTNVIYKCNYCLKIITALVRVFLSWPQDRFCYQQLVAFRFKSFENLENASGKKSLEKEFFIERFRRILAKLRHLPLQRFLNRVWQIDILQTTSLVPLSFYFTQKQSFLSSSFVLVSSVSVILTMTPMLYFCIMLVNTISVIKQRKLDTVFFD